MIMKDEDIQGYNVNAESLAPGKMEEIRNRMRELEDKLRHGEIMATMNNAFTFETDENSRFTYVSESVTEVLGYEPEDLVNQMHFCDLAHESFQEKTREAGRVYFRDRKPFNKFTSLMQAKDGREVWLITNAIPLLTEEGTLKGYYGAGRDITAFRRAMEGMKASNAYKETLINSLDELIFVLDNGLYYREIHCPDDDLLMVPRKEIIGKHVTQIITQEPASGQIRKSMLEVVEKGTSQSVEYWLDLPIGRKWFDARISRLADGAGNIQGVLSVIRDITRTKEIELTLQEQKKQLEESEQAIQNKLQAILTPEGDLSCLTITDVLNISELQELLDELQVISGIGVCIKDLEGKVVIASDWQDLCVCFHRELPETARFCQESNVFLQQEIPFGTYQSFKCGNGLWDLSTPIVVGERRLGILNIGQFFYDDEEVDEAFYQNRAGIYGFDEESYLDAFNRIPRWSRQKVSHAMQYCIHLTHLISNQVYANLKLAQSLEELKRMQQVLILEKERAESANRSKTQFLNNMSHELRTPLNGLMGMTQLLQMTELNEEQEEYVGISMKSCTNLANVMNEILQYTSLDRKTEALVEVAFYPRDLLKEAAELHQVAVKNKKLTFTCHVSPEVPEKMEGDCYKIKQVLNNLTGNAVKFTERGSVTLFLTLASSRVNQRQQLCFEVEDTGIGIPPEQQSLIFDSFSQADYSHTRMYGGVGLGLSISQELAQLMGGNITVTSTPGQGSSFRFVCEATVLEREDVARNIKETSGVVMNHARRVLVVDDDYAGLRLAGVHLEREGFLVDTAENGKEAIEKVSAGSYDLILMDLQMPVMDGFEATRFIRNLSDKEASTIPIIAMTAAGLPEVQNKCREYGMNDYLLKPIEMELLLKKVQRY